MTGAAARRLAGVQVAWLALALAGCASSPQRLPEGLADVAGHYDTVAQFEAAPADLRRAPAAGHPYDWLDRQAARFAWVDVPALGPNVLYLEWRAGGPEGSISRQRLWHFKRDGGAWKMDFYTLRDPAPLAGAADVPDAFARLTVADLVGYGERCTLGSRDAAPAGLVFEIPASCQIVTRSGRPMSLSATVSLMPGRLAYREAGRLPDGSHAFLVPGRPGLDYLFERVSGP